MAKRSSGKKPRADRKARAADAKGETIEPESPAAESDTRRAYSRLGDGRTLYFDLATAKRWEGRWRDDSTNSIHRCRWDLHRTPDGTWIACCWHEFEGATPVGSRFAPARQPYFEVSLEYVDGLLRDNRVPPPDEFLDDLKTHGPREVEPTRDEPTATAPTKPAVLVDAEDLDKTWIKGRRAELNRLFGIKPKNTEFLAQAAKDGRIDGFCKLGPRMFAIKINDPKRRRDFQAELDANRRN